VAIPPGFSPQSSFAQEQVQGEIRAYAVRYRNADDLAPQLRNMLSGLPGKSSVSVDREGNRLLVQGLPKSHQLALQVIQTLDKPVVAAPATNASNSVVKSYQVAGDVESVAAQLRTRYPDGSGVRIAADPRTQQLLVIAPAALQQRIAQEIPGRAPQAGPPAVLPPRSVPTIPVATVQGTPYQLKHLTWREFEGGLQRLLGARIRTNTARNGEILMVHLATDAGIQPVLQIDRATNTITFERTAQTEAWRQLSHAIDTATVAAPGEMQLVPIRNADPKKVQTAVTLIRAAQNSRDGHVTAAVQPGGGRRSNGWNGRILKVFQDNGQANPAADQPAAAQPGAAQPGAGQPGAPAGADEAFTIEDDGASGLLGPVQIEFLEGLDIIIIRGRKRDVERVQQIIADIEAKSKETQPIVEVHHLKYIDGEAAVILVTELYDEILSARQGQVSIRALVDPNALLLIGRKESVKAVIELITKLDQPDTGNFTVIRLKYIAALTAEQTIRGFFVTKPGTDDSQRTGLGIQVKIIADYRTNSLIVQASPRDLGEIRRLVEIIDIDGRDTKTSMEIKVFRLKNALALDLADALLGAIYGEVGTQQPQGQQPGAAGGTQTQSQVLRPATALEFMIKENGRMIKSGIMDDVQVTADPNINALLVRAPAESMELIAALIFELDQLPDMEALIKVFTVVNSDATNLAAMLQSLFGQQVTVGQGNAQNIFGFQQPQAVQSAGEGSLVPLTFAVDIRTNSIIASGSASDLVVVETLLLRLDEDEIAKRRLSVVRLKNAPALDVANSITTFLQSQRDLIQQQLLFNQAISPYEQIEREVIVVPEIVTNSLIVSATPKYYEEIMQVIKELDFRPPMVMVQVLIAEVQLTGAFEFGVEMGLQDALLFNRGIAGTTRDPGFNFTNGAPGLPNLDTDAGPGRLAGQALSSFGIGRSSAIPGVGFGGLVLSAASDSINLLIRALEQEGRLQVLSRPQIMALNNQEAFIQVGAAVARITGTTVSGAGVVQQNVQDVETGLILAIQPLINDDGVIVMKIEAERSALGSEQDGTVIGFDNGQPIRSPPINKITASTTISCKSGQTVVFAGLMTSNRETLERKVPFLGDVPLLGNLFRYESDVNKKTELLIIMTPYIISDDEDYEMIKMMESQRMSWCLGDVASLHGDVGLMSNGCVFCDADIPVIYPDLDPFGVMPHNWGHNHKHDGGYYDSPLPEGSPVPVPPTPVDQVDYRASQFAPARRLPPATRVNPPRPLYGPPQTAPRIQRVGFQATQYVAPPSNATSAIRRSG
jgi:type II secretion system protein D